MFYKNVPLTVAQAIEKLKELPPGAHIIVTDWDSEYGGTHYNHVHDIGLSSIKKDGKDLVFVADGLCKEDWYEEDTWDDEDDDEVDYDSEEESTPYMTEEEVEKHLAWIKENEGSL